MRRLADLPHLDAHAGHGASGVIHIQLMSKSYHARPGAGHGVSVMLLCQHSQKSSSPPQKCRESSRVWKRRLPQRCVAELTSVPGSEAVGVREKCPQDIRNAAKPRAAGRDHLRHPVPIGEGDMELSLAEIGGSAPEHLVLWA